MRQTDTWAQSRLRGTARWQETFESTTSNAMRAVEPDRYAGPPAAAETPRPDSCERVRVWGGGWGGGGKWTRAATRCGGYCGVMMRMISTNTGRRAAQPVSVGGGTRVRTQDADNDDDNDDDDDELLRGTRVPSTN